MAGPRSFGERAITLSISKYCGVYHSLRDDLKLRPQFRIHATGAEASGDYQVVEMAPPTTEVEANLISSAALAAKRN